MEKQDFERLLKEITRGKSDKPLIEYIEEEAIRLANSGGIDLSTYEPNEYTPIKICLSLALSKNALEYRPLSREAQKVAENLKNF